MFVRQEGWLLNALITFQLAIQNGWFDHNAGSGSSADSAKHSAFDDAALCSAENRLEGNTMFRTGALKLQPRKLEAREGQLYTRRKVADATRRILYFGGGAMHKQSFSSHSVRLILVFVGILVIPATALAQRAGQSVTVQYGVVQGSKQVDLNSGAVPGGVLVGGSLGLASASGKSSSRKARNAIIGAMAGGIIAGAAQGSQTGMLYQVDIGAGGQIQVVTDQREIKTGDCVAVEKAGETANIRRVSSAYCDKANAAAVKAVQSETRHDAMECLAAKQQLVDATTTAQADLAARKITLLCND
jgi:hypothetical protein